MGMEELIPVIVTGGVVKKFSDNMLPTQQRRGGKKTQKVVRKINYPSKHRPF